MDNFEEIISQMPRLLMGLKGRSLVDRLDVSKNEIKGIYVFYENDNPIYVGRSKNIRNRLDQHCRNSSDHNSAPFAFNLAKEKYGLKFDKTDGMSRKQLSTLPAFDKLFTLEKERVSRMKIRYIEVPDPHVQTIFEVYVALMLETTKYNDFDTH
ncbi:MAG: GIY-YIG nuclease family protein [Dehalococcoidia bacterium]|nr:GIY-YIG nuclease family protein [Dehalococcoidia bacterium]